MKIIKYIIICILYISLFISNLPDAMGATYVMTASPDPLYEVGLNGASIKLVISGTDFKQGGSLIPSNYQLNNAPPGVTINEVLPSSVNTTYLILAFDGTNFDIDYTNVSVTVLPDGNQAKEVITSNTITIQATKEIAGEGNYIATGEAYPTLIEMTGYNTKAQELHLNTRIHTQLNVTGKTATFDYFIKVYDGSGTEIGSFGDINATHSVTGTMGSQDVDINGIMIPLSQDFPAAYRIVITVKSVTLH